MQCLIVKWPVWIGVWLHFLVAGVLAYLLLFRPDATRRFLQRRRSSVWPQWMVDRLWAYRVAGMIVLLQFLLLAVLSVNGVYCLFHGPDLLPPSPAR